MNSIKIITCAILMSSAFACQAQPQQQEQPKKEAAQPAPVKTTQAGELKIGYTNVDYVLSLMPESKQIEADLKAYSSQLEQQLQSKIKDYEGKMQAYEKGAATMTDVIKADKEKQIVNLRGEIEEFQKNAEASVQRKQQSLLEPALDKLQKTIDKVAKENGYTYVFNSDAGYGTTPILLHGPDEHNISDLVLKSMGVTPPVKDSTKTSTGASPSSTTKPATPAITPKKK